MKDGPIILLRFVAEVVLTRERTAIVSKPCRWQPRVFRSQVRTKH